MAALNPAYLVCGDDDAKIDAWRARVRRRAEDERGPGGLELFDARQSDPGEVAAALAMLSFETATRYLLVDDVGAWKAGELPPLEEALNQLPPETVLVLIARGKHQKQLAKAVEKAGTVDPDKVIDALPGTKAPNLTGGMSEMLPNHHITKPVFIGEVRADGQFDVVWKTPGLVAGDAWSKELDGSKDLIGDWVKLKCCNYNTKTNKCGGQGS